MERNKTQDPTGQEQGSGSGRWAESPLWDPQDENSMEVGRNQTVSKPVNHQVTVDADIQLLSCGRGIRVRMLTNQSVVQTNTRV